MGRKGNEEGAVIRALKGQVTKHLQIQLQLDRPLKRKRTTGQKEDKLIKMMHKVLKDGMNEIQKEFKKFTSKTKDDISEMSKQLKELHESHNELRKQWELRTNGSSVDDSAASRLESNQVQPPRYRLEFKCEVKDEIEKDQVIETKTHGKLITVALYDDHNQIVETGPLASAKVMLVIVNGEFNQHGNQYNWSKKDFERNIKRPRQGNLAIGDVNQSAESIVKNCFFNRVRGVQSHGDATILYNSSNKKVKLGVMVVSPTEERVLEGLSNSFFVRGHDRPARKSILPHNRRERQSAVVPTQLRSSATMPSDPGNSTVPSTGQVTTVEQTLMQSYPNSHPATYGQGEVESDIFDLDSIWNLCSSNANGTEFNVDHVALPVQLVWDWPIMEPRKSWNLLDQLMPLYSCKQKFNNCGAPGMHLMAEHLGSLTLIPKDVMQTRRRRGVLVAPLERDDSHEKGPLEKRLHSRYKLRFLNKVCKVYYTRDRIKADDRNLLKVALFDENNTKITSGPLSSASIELIVLHGDFNADGQDYWTSEDFSRYAVCRWPGKSEAVLGGDRIFILANGEACLGDTFFKITSFHARTGKFILGVRPASAQDVRIQEGISEPFLVREHPWQEAVSSSSSGGGCSGLRSPCTAQLPGFRFHPTDEELIIHYLRKRAAAAPCPAPVVAEVDIYKFDPWDLPAKAAFGEAEWYFFSPRDRKYPNGVRPNRAAGSGYWKATGTDKPITLSAAAGDSSDGSGRGAVIGFKKALVFYRGRPPKGMKTSWIMHEYRLAEAIAAANTYRPIRFKKSMRLDDWVLCRIYKKATPQLPPLLPPPPLDDTEPYMDNVLVHGHGHVQQQYGGSVGVKDVATTMYAPDGGRPSISDYLVDYSVVPELFDSMPAQTTKLPVACGAASKLAQEAVNGGLLQHRHGDDGTHVKQQQEGAQ